VLRRLGDWIERGSEKIASVLYRICVFSIVAMMFLTMADVCGRYFLAKPITGAYEITEFLLIMAVAAGLAFTQVKGRHVSVEFVLTRLSPPWQNRVQGVNLLICFGIYVLIAWQAIKGAQTQWRHHITSAAFQGLPLWPFYLFLALGAGVLSLIFLSGFLKLLRKTGSGP
jgi:TRAP-type C4-dicarboxylate transport system permease small subunit